MKQYVRVVLCVVGAACIAVGASSLQAQVEPEPLWAYAWSTQPKPDDKAAPQAAPNRNLRPNEDPQEQTKPQTVQGSSAKYSLVDIRDGHNVIDWFPGDHPAMPSIIKNGPASLGESARGCGSCHLPNGKGRPENAPPAGQPAGYTVQQLRDFRDGKRYTADPRKPNTFTMIALAKAMTEDEMRQSAEYFARMPWTPWMRVVEADTIPEMHLEPGNMYVSTGSGKTEPLSGRIVEAPENEFQANGVRNTRSGWVVYTPVGSLARGKNLVTTGGGKTVGCATCHGTDLMGLADIPGIAGRSPSYMMRQLWDMKRGTRDGLWAEMMKPVIANLNVDDLTAIVGYLASITPPTPAPTGSQ
ncbi:MAG: c-type cytochrome [Acidobacteria bacterium]|nr:c-type cytochrome [Acidobacteriota bacterium]